MIAVFKLCGDRLSERGGDREREGERERKRRDVDAIQHTHTHTHTHTLTQSRFQLIRLPFHKIVEKENFSPYSEGLRKRTWLNDSEFSYSVFRKVETI